MPSIYMIPLLKRIAKDSYLSWGLLLLGLICIADVFRFIYAPIGRAGVVWWGLSFVYILIFAAKSFAHIVHNSRIHKSFFTLIGICVWIALIGFYVTNPKSLSGETAQEIACSLGYLSAGSDWGFGQTCLFGYPARQFIGPALPSLIFGRSLLTLNIGGALYFLAGIIIFAKGIIDTISDYKLADRVGLLLLATLLHFHFIVHTLFLFEQSIFPLSFALMGTGLWLIYQKEKRVQHLLLFTMIILYTLYTYTPALALAGLGFILLAWTAVQKNQSQYTRLTLGILSTIVILMGILSLRMRADVAVTSQYPGGITGLARDIMAALQHLAFQTMRTPFMSWVITWIFIPAILFPLSGKLGKSAKAISIWTLATFVLSVFAKGYTFYNIDYRLQRFILVIPVVFASIVYATRHVVHKSGRVFIGIASLAILFSGLSYAGSYQHNRPTNTHLRFITWLNTQAIPVGTPLYLIGAATPENNLQSLPDAMKYFYPNNHVMVQNENLSSCPQLPASSFIVFRTDSTCAHSYAPLATYQDVYTNVTLVLAKTPQ